ncbi:DNA-binding NarL/FixJ family response regulator [Streptomyces ambofaciens]
MSRVEPVTRWGKRLGDRSRARAERVLRVLHDDLWTWRADPLPPSVWLRWFPHGIVCLAAFGVLLGNTAQLNDHSKLQPEFAFLIALGSASAMVLALWRPVPAWWLSTAAAVVGAFAVLMNAEDYKFTWPWTAAGLIAHMFVMLLLALRVRTRVAVEACALSALITYILEGLIGAQNYQPTGWLAVALFAVVVVLGIALRGRREARSQLAEQTSLTAEERARRTLLEERGRIARELHDVVAHHMSVISIQAQVAPLLVKDPPDELKENLAGIRQNALEALTELRRVLGVLRAEHPDAPAASEGADAAVPHAPQPTLDRLDALVENTRAAGLTVNHRHERDAQTAAARRGAVGLPDRAGGAQQRAAACAGRECPGPPHPSPDRAARGGLQHPAAARTGAVAGGRARAARHAGAGGDARRHADGAPHAGRRLPGGRVPAGRRPRAARRRLSRPFHRGRHPMTTSSNGRVIRVLIADDQQMVRQGFTVLLNTQPDIEVIGQAVDGLDAVAKVAELAPEVVLMDIRMPELGGIEATRRITGATPEIRVLVLTTFDLDEYVYEALRAGASGFLLKDASADQLAEAVRVVAAGDALLAPGITRRLIAEFSRLDDRPRAPLKARVGELTERETEVLALIAQGLSNAEIAQRLVVAEQTVKTHVGRILVKLGLRDRTQAAVFAYESGLVRPAGY